MAPAGVGVGAGDPARVGPLDRRRPAREGVAVSAAHAERRLGLALAAPAFFAMTLVTAYPLARAAWLSLFRDRLTDPAGRTFVGLANYRTILTDPLWWQVVGTTFALTAVSVALQMVLGFLLALAMLRTGRGRAAVRTAVLVPYGIVTV